MGKTTSCPKLLTDAVVENSSTARQLAQHAAALGELQRARGAQSALLDASLAELGRARSVEASRIEAALSELQVLRVQDFPSGLQQCQNEIMGLRQMMEGAASKVEAAFAELRSLSMMVVQQDAVAADLQNLRADFERCEARVEH